MTFCTNTQIDSYYVTRMNIQRFYSLSQADFFLFPHFLFKLSPPKETPVITTEVPGA